MDLELQRALVAGGILQTDEPVVPPADVDAAHVLRRDEHVLLARALLGAFDLGVNLLSPRALVVVLTSIRAASWRLIMSRNTSHSSKQRIVEGMRSHSASRKQTVTYERSPPLSSWGALMREPPCVSPRPVDST